MQTVHIDFFSFASFRFLHFHAESGADTNLWFVRTPVVHRERGRRFMDRFVMTRNPICQCTRASSVIRLFILVKGNQASKTSISGIIDRNFWHERSITTVLFCLWKLQSKNIKVENWSKFSRRNFQGLRGAAQLESEPMMINIHSFKTIFKT